MGRVDGKVVIVTGGARGQGASHTRTLVREGASVVFTDVLESEGREVEKEIGKNARFLRHDVRLADEWKTVVGEAESTFGPVTVLVNNAGITLRDSLADTSEADFRRVTDVNEIGSFLGMQAVLPSMLRAGGGSIINVSSIAGLVGIAPIAYTASKFAIRGLTKSAAVQLGADNIRVNSVVIGVVNTAMHGQKPGFIPLGRIAEPEDISKMILFLASEDSSYCTGADFVIDGGMTCVAG